LGNPIQNSAEIAEQWIEDKRGSQNPKPKTDSALHSGEIVNDINDRMCAEVNIQVGRRLPNKKKKGQQKEFMTCVTFRAINP